METEVRTNSRGTRRKKIIERGADRFALITGRIQTLDNNNNNNNNNNNANNDDHSSSTHHSYTKSSPDFFSKNNVGLKGESEQGFADGGNAVDNGGGRVEPQLRKCETNTEAISAAFAGFREEVQLSPVIPRVPKAASYDTKNPVSKSGGGGFFTLKEINRCILASENTRVFCSVMIALLVVLSYVNLPRKIVKSKSVIASEPLYVLLLTDFAVVIGLLILGKTKGSEDAKEEVKDTQNDGHNWEGAVTVLEVGLVLHQALRALFIDCSFYVVIVVIGFSIM